MADVQPLPEICCLKSTEILVHVEEALLDFLVVSYEHDSKLYQGVLLDSSKRSLPCGILTPPGFPEVDSAQHGLGSDEDKMYSVAQRYSYFQEKCSPPVNVPAKDSSLPGSAYLMRRAMRGGHSKFKNSRMTVRLRPRQVLCSKCKSICNENSENVDLSRKRKGAESTPPIKGPVEKKVCPPRQISPKSPRPPFSENPQDNKPSLASRRKNSSSPPVASPSLRQSLIPKTVIESEIPQTLSSNVNKIKIVPEYWPKQSNESCVPAENSRTSMSHTKSNSNTDMGSTECLEEISFGMSKNHSLEATEREKLTEDDASTELYGSDVYVKNSSIVEASDNAADSLSKFNSSFASSETDESQDRMVLRKKRNVGSMEDLWDESVFLEDTTRRTTPVIKISFGSQGEGTVLKIPAKVRSYHDSESDFEDQETKQPKTSTKEARTKAAKKALKKAKKEARRKVNGDKPGSPSRPGGSSPYQRRRKRKVKHKKRHKGVRAQHEMNAVEEEVDVDVPPLLEEDPLKIDDQPNNEESTVINNCDIDSMKEKCLKQKLSISLKRLTATAYARCGDTSCSTGSDSPGSNSEFSGADDLPDFPILDAAHTFLTVESCDTGDGRIMEVGDVVWGKIHGFPWWPGKVLSISIEKKEEPQRPQAHVAWYGSSTSSRMPCDQLCPFLETFKTRYNKKKRGPYKEAIRQATCEARKASLDPLATCEARKDNLDSLSTCEARRDSLNALATCEALKDSLDPLQEVDIVL